MLQGKSLKALIKETRSADPMNVAKSDERAAKNPALVANLKGAGGAVTGFQWWNGGTGGQWLAASSDDGNVRVYDASKPTSAGTPLATFKVGGVPVGVVFLETPQSMAVLSGGASGGSVVAGKGSKAGWSQQWAHYDVHKHAPKVTPGDGRLRESPPSFPLLEQPGNRIACSAELLKQLFTMNVLWHCRVDNGFGNGRAERRSVDHSRRDVICVCVSGPNLSNRVHAPDWLAGVAGRCASLRVPAVHRGSSHVRPGAWGCRDERGGGGDAPQRLLCQGGEARGDGTRMPAQYRALDMPVRARTAVATAPSPAAAAATAGARHVQGTQQPHRAFSRWQAAGRRDVDDGHPGVGDQI